MTLIVEDYPRFNLLRFYCGEFFRVDFADFTEAHATVLATHCYITTLRSRFTYRRSFSLGPSRLSLDSWRILT